MAIFGRGKVPEGNATLTAPRGKLGFERFARQRPGKQESLPAANAVLQQPVALLGVFHAFGHHRQRQHFRDRG